MGCLACGLAAGRPIVVAGDSAGGNLALVTALRARDAGGPALAMQLLVYPVADCDLDRRSYHEYDGDEFIVNRGDMVWFWDHYAPDPAARVNPYASPLRAGDLTGLPPAYVITAEHDPLRDEGFECAERLRAARVPVEHRHFGSQIHGFFTFVNLLDDADRAVADAGLAIRAAVGAAASAATRPRLPRRPRRRPPRNEFNDGGSLGTSGCTQRSTISPRARESVSMRATAAVFEKLFTPLSVAEVEVDSPGPGEALVKVVASGVCHTDAIARDGDMPFPAPGVLGHEGAGIVAAVGSGVTNVASGTRW